MSISIKQKVSAIENIGKIFSNTPVAKLSVKYKGRDFVIYGKCEFFSFTGSVKDRVMRKIVKDGLEQGLIDHDTVLVEATSGNAGIALSGLSKVIGNPCEVITPTWTTPERQNIIKHTGSDVILLTEKQGGYSGCIKHALSKQKESNYFCPNQFNNSLNIEAHTEGEMGEFFTFFKKHGIKPEVFASGYGTGGTLMSSVVCKDQYDAKELSIYAIEPSRAKMLLNGHKPGYSSVDHLEHMVEGISDDLIPSLIDSSKFDDVLEIDDEDAIILSQKVNKAGLNIGISSGLNILGCLKSLYASGRKTGMTVFYDNNLKYLQTLLFSEVPKKNYFMTNEIEIVNFELIQSK